jgi:hypothetical protein
MQLSGPSAKLCNAVFGEERPYVRLAPIADILVGEGQSDLSGLGRALERPLL